MADRKRPARWRLYNSGRPRSYQLHRGRTVLAYVQETTNGKWFWYTSGEELPSRNTATQPANTLEDAKAEVEIWMRENA